MIQRFLTQKIDDYLHKGKAILLLGGRQIGKTTLLQQLFLENDDIIWLKIPKSEMVAPGVLDKYICRFHHQ